MEKADEKLNKVPFDPGFAPHVLVFSTTYFYMDAQVRKFKNANQRKMKYRAYESGLIKLCDNLISFYFGGMLYGAYLKYNNKNEPKELDGNDFLNIELEKCLNGDVVIEVRALEKFIKHNERNPFASKKLNPKYTTVIDDYIEFLELNKYFTQTHNTSDIKLPKHFSYISRYSQNSLDDLHDTIMSVINAGKIENILSSKYFEKVNAEEN